MESFGPFRLVRPLGEGGMGEVFLARTPWPEHPLAALKRLHQDAYQTENFVRRFEHEAQLAVRLKHPHVVSALDVGSVDGRLYMASELVFGKDASALAIKLADQGLGVPLSVALWILTELLDALTYVHNALDKSGQPLQLIHRDVTPRNILLDYRGITKLADFGMAKSTLTLGEALTAENSVLGTPSYLPPEALQGRPPSWTTDMYGAGTVIYTLLTGLPPYWGNVHAVLTAILTESPHPVAQLRPDLPDWFIDVMDQLMHRNPLARPRPEVLRNQLIERGRKERLLAPRRIIHQWMLDVFRAEHAKEAPALAHAKAVDPIARPDEKTVVFAHINPKEALRSAVAVRVSDKTEALTISDGEFEAFENEDTFRADAMEPAPVHISLELERKLQSFDDSALLSSLSIDASSELAPRPPSVRKLASRILSASLAIDPSLARAPTDPDDDFEGFEAPVEDTVRAPYVPKNPAARIASTQPEAPTTNPVQTRPWLPWIAGLVVGTILAGAIALALIFGSGPNSIRHAGLEARYFRAHEALVSRKNSGKTVPGKAWMLSSKAADALSRKDYDAAESALEALEEHLPPL